MSIARNLANSVEIEYTYVESWFRDSWKYLGSATIVVNCSILVLYLSSHLIIEAMILRRWLRSMLE